LLLKIQAIMPDITIEHLERNQEGLINDVFMVNNQYVFRFARSDEYGRMLEVEAEILDLIRPHLGVQVPEPVYLGQGCMVYPYLAGEPLERKRVLSLDSGKKMKIAKQIGTILYKLHHMDVSDLEADIPDTRAPVRREDWLDIQRRLKLRIYPLMQHYQIEWGDYLMWNDQ
jgi:aminoglycoside 2''-phosphotransferase